MNGELTYEDARQLALQHLFCSLPEQAPKLQPTIVETATIERPGGWVFFWNTRLYLETGDLAHAVVGPEPVYVKRRDGGVSSMVSMEPIAREILRHERRIGVRPWWKLW